jgi:phenylalanyl-tRNA synthetase beta chain
VVHLRKARLDLKLGHEVPTQRVREIFESLQFGVADAEDGLAVTVPSFRASRDIAIEDDLIEEVGRMFRYDNIPETPLVSVVEVPHREEELYLARDMCRAIALELCATEVYNYSFLPDGVLEAVGALGEEYSRVRNPVAPEATRIRRHVMPSLLACLVPPNRAGAERVRVFEHGKGYHPDTRDKDGLPAEVREIAIAFVDTNASPYPELRSQVLSLLSRHGFPVELDELLGSASTPWVHPGKTVAITYGQDVAGYVGVVHPQVARSLDLPGGTAIANLDLRRLLRVGRQRREFVEMSRFPVQPVDVALMVPEGTQVKTCAEFLRATGKKLVRSVTLFEVYRGEGLAPGTKSLNFTVTLGSGDRTLTSKDEEKYLSAVRDSAAKAGAELRG